MAAFQLRSVFSCLPASSNRRCDYLTFEYSFPLGFLGGILLSLVVLQEGTDIPGQDLPEVVNAAEPIELSRRLDVLNLNNDVVER